MEKKNVKLVSKEFKNSKEAYIFAREVHGFVEHTTDDKLDRNHIVFYKERGSRL